MAIQQRSQLKGFGQSTNEKYIVEDIHDLVTEANTKPYKVFTALLTQSGGSDIISVKNENLIIGVTYVFDEVFQNSGADFTNVGAPNNNVGTYFIATGTTPNSWGEDGSETTLIYNSGSPVVTVLENTIGNIWFTYVGVGGYFVFSDGLFTQNKSSMIVGNVTWDGGSGIIKSGFDDESSGIIITSLVDGTNVNNGSLLNTPIEIRVYN